MVTEPAARLSTDRYLCRKTLILGDVNSGKTHLTRTIIDAFCHSGHAKRMVVIDLAPEAVKGIGGKLVLPEIEDLAYLTCPIVPPRLTAETEKQIHALARQNAAAIDILFDQAIGLQRSIIVINDASLYLQAGRLNRMLVLVNTFETAVINAYLGSTFASTPFSHGERQLVEAFARRCDCVVRLPQHQRTPS
jgi:hypothetical protein